MRLLDLFCGAGGAGMGYYEAGFDVVGVDIHQQRRYPFAFIQYDALKLDQRFLRSFDAIHASPPCQDYSAMRHAPGAKGAPRLIEPVRRMLRASGLPYVIENVEGAPLLDPITLCGSMFGLGAQGCQLRRHRLFESNIELFPQPPCAHSDEPVVGIYGGHARKRAARHGGRGTRDMWEGGHIKAARQAMEMPWATLSEMSEAIPPAYTGWIGERLVRAIDSMRIAA